MRINLDLKQWILVSLFILFVLYILFQARFLILGPEVSINFPQDGESVSESVLTIKGRARNAAWLNLNGRQIFTDEKGFWEERVVLSKGLSIMTLVAHDRFGREEKKSVRIIYN